MNLERLGRCIDLRDGAQKNVRVSALRSRIGMVISDSGM